MRCSINRDRIIIRTSIIGIISNVLLASFKAAVGLISGSIAIVLDAVNNLSDALSSVITIIGTKLAGKKPDREHPFGHGRVEYISAVVIAVIVIYAGIQALIESIKKIIFPTVPDYSAVTLLVVISAIAAKLILGTYVERTGRKVSSDPLIASGKDALLDAVISASTLAAAVIFLLSKVSLEAWLGTVISLIIIRSGIKMVRESISDILGERIDSSLSKEIKRAVTEFPEVYGAYDLLLHSYGPNLYIGSVHIEVQDTLTITRLDELEREIAQKIFKDFGVMLTGISVYSHNTDNSKADQIHQEVRRIVMSHEGVLQMHGFHLNTEKTSMNFDIVMDFAVADRAALYDHILSDIQSHYPDYKVAITLDLDVSD